MTYSNDARWAWVAGFLEADGWFGITTSNADGYSTCRIEATNCDRRTLDKLVELSQCGKVYGPYEQRGIGSQPTFRWRINRQGEVQTVASNIRPYVVSYKAETIDAILKLLAERGYAEAV